MTELKRQTQRFQTALEWLKARADCPDAVDSSSSVASEADAPDWTSPQEGTTSRPSGERTEIDPCRLRQSSPETPQKSEVVVGFNFSQERICGIN